MLREETFFSRCINISGREVLRMNFVRGLLARAAEHWELPADVLAGLPRMELIGCGEFSVEPHGGLEEYGTEQIVVRTAVGNVVIAGGDLRLQSMSRDRVTVKGCIRSLSLEEPANG